MSRVNVLPFGSLFLVVLSLCAVPGWVLGQEAAPAAASEKKDDAAPEAAKDAAPQADTPAEPKEEGKKEEGKKEEAKSEEAKKEETKTDDGKKEEPKKEEPAPEASKPADAKEKADQPAAEGTPAARYEAKLAEWKQLLKDLRELKARYDAAEKGQLDEIRGKWAEMIAKGEKLMPELRDAAMKAYEAAPNEDRQLTRLLIKMVDDDMNRDAYESVLPLARLLADNNPDSPDASRAAGMASFATGDFESAEKYFQVLEKSGAMTDESRNILKDLENYKKYGVEEEELRKKEAEANDLPRVRLTTSKGDIVVELFENEAPETVGNFVSLVEKGFYNDKVFHRVLKGFMAQGGCPKGDGSGGPGYNIYCECYKPNYRKHFRGTLSMAHAGRDTGGSQFFLTFLPTPHLNGKHTAFGRVIEGMEVLDKLQRIDPQASEQPAPDKIVKAEVVRKRDHEYVPNKVQ